jgi:hypothetical protein
MAGMKLPPLAAGWRACGVSPEAATGQDAQSLSSAIYARDGLQARHRCGLKDLILHGNRI